MVQGTEVEVWSLVCHIASIISGLAINLNVKLTKHC